MKYEVLLSYSAEGLQYVDVENVVRVHTEEDITYFTNQAGEDLLIVPVSKLVYAKIVTE